MTNETFQCHLAPGLNVKVDIDMTALEQGQPISQVLKFTWTGRPKPKHFPRYVAWMHTVIGETAKRVNKRILYVYPSADGSKPCGYVYKPDGSYEICKE